MPVFIIDSDGAVEHKKIAESPVTEYRLILFRVVYGVVSKGQSRAPPNSHKRSERVSIITDAFFI